MRYKQIIKSFSSAMFALSVGMMALFLIGCTNSGTKIGTNSNTNATATPNSNASSVSTSSVAPEPREPDRYSVTTTITVQPTGNTPTVNVPQLQFNFARNGSDSRRVSFNLPDPVGQVIYLEKGTFKYLVFPLRNQYVEIDPNELGFQLGNLLSPVSIIERLKDRTSYEVVGTETVNGRTATKYRFKGAADTRTQAGTVQADSIIYVDQVTGLPLRSEVDAVLSNGKGAHVTTETSSIQLEPESSLFDVPTGMKKVTTAELKQQVQGFVNAIRVFAAYMRQQTGASATPAN